MIIFLKVPGNRLGPGAYYFWWSQVLTVFYLKNIFKTQNGLWNETVDPQTSPASAHPGHDTEK